MSTKPLVRAMVAGTAVAVMSVTGAGMATASTAAEHATTTTHSQSSNFLDKQTAKQLWAQLADAGKQHDLHTVKHSANKILNGLPQTRSVAQARQLSRAHSLAGQVPDLPKPPSIQKALCETVAALVTTVGGLVSGLLGIPADAPVDICNLPVPPTPGTPTPSTS